MTARESLAAKLDHLFETVRRRNGQEFSYEEVAATISSGGVVISQSYIWQLRKGKRDNPTFKHLQALADFFGVPPAYFFDNDVADRVNQQLKALRDEQHRLTELADTSRGRAIAMRAGELTPDRRQLVENLLDVVWREQQSEQKRTES